MDRRDGRIVERTDIRTVCTDGQTNRRTDGRTSARLSARPPVFSLTVRRSVNRTTGSQLAADHADWTSNQANKRGRVRFTYDAIGNDAGSAHRRHQTQPRRDTIVSGPQVTHNLTRPHITLGPCIHMTPNPTRKERCKSDPYSTANRGPQGDPKHAHTRRRDPLTLAHNHQARDSMSRPHTLHPLNQTCTVLHRIAGDIIGKEIPYFSKTSSLSVSDQLRSIRRL